MKLTVTEYDTKGDEKFTVVLDADGQIAVTMKNLVAKARRMRKSRSGIAKDPRGDKIGRYSITIKQPKKDQSD